MFRSVNGRRELLFHYHRLDGPGVHKASHHRRTAVFAPRPSCEGPSPSFMNLMASKAVKHKTAGVEGAEGGGGGEQGRGHVKGS